MPQNPITVLIWALNPDNVSAPLRVDADGNLMVAVEADISLGAVTIESGGVAAGAYAAGAIAAGAFVAGAMVDGSDVTQGHIGDAAWSGSGNATLVAALKAVNLALGLKADAAWTGSGDATEIAALKALSLAIGKPSDVAWVAGDGSVIAILKTIAANTA